MYASRVISAVENELVSSSAVSYRTGRTLFATSFGPMIPRARSTCTWSTSPDPASTCSIPGRTSAPISDPRSASRTSRSAGVAITASPTHDGITTSSRSGL